MDNLRYTDRTQVGEQLTLVVRRSDLVRNCMVEVEPNRMVAAFQRNLFGWVPVRLACMTKAAALAEVRKADTVYFGSEK